jgi:F-type H+-transporting ATPase subunit b
MLDFTLLSAAAEAAHGAAEHHEAPTALLLSPGGWVAASMLAVFALMLYMKVPALVAGMLDKQIADIRKQLDDAARLRAEAEALKAEYEKKLGDAAKDADAMRAAADEEAKLIVAKAKADASALIERRGKSAEEKIAAAERGAVAELRAKAAQAATLAARGLIADGHDAKADKSLVDEAIAAI